MKILELRFKNLNSLYGEWVIDFSDPEYVSNGIFALTGPTGAGKSTILDAICLALYGSTPRLGKITKSENEIMSRQTGECYAEVLFESQAGRFRCNWAQHRSRKKAGGDLQSPHHEIAEGVPDGKVIENQIRSVQSAVEEKTGMDFDRFTRSILLAQGGFDTFLKADIEQKSKILEQITGTGIYSIISQRVHERHRDERTKLNLIQAETSGIVLLEPEQENELRRGIETKKKEETELSGKSSETEKAITWLTAIDDLKKEVTTLAEEAENLQGDIETFKPERHKLDRGIKASLLDGPYATLTSLRKQQSDDLTSLETEKTTLPELKASANIQAEALKLSEKRTVDSKKELREAAPLIQEVRSLDQSLAEQGKSISQGDESCTKDAAKNDKDKQVRLKKKETRTKTEKNLELAVSYLKEHVRDEWLISNLAGVEEQLGSLLFKHKEISLKEATLKKTGTTLEQASRKIDACANQCGIHKLKLENTSNKIQKEKDALDELLGDQLLREYRTEKDTLLREMAFLSKIAELEDHRTKLEDGKPCPLCGAIEHPFAEGNVPAPDETEKKIEVLTKLISEAENHETTIRKFETTEVDARKNLTNCDKLHVTAVNDKNAIEKTLTELKDSLETVRLDFTELKQRVSAKLQPLGITEIPDADVSSLIESLNTRLNAWQAQVTKKTEIDKQIADLDSEMMRLDAVMETQNIALVEKRDSLKTLKKELIAGSIERKELYDDKNPADEEIRLNKVVTDAEETEKKARILDTDLQKKLNTAKTQIDALKKRSERRDPELNKAEADFSTALVPATFIDEKQFLEARLTTEHRQTLSVKAKVLDDGQTDLRARQTDRNMRLATEVAKKVTVKSLEELRPQFKEYDESLKEVRNVIVDLKHKLSENSAARLRIKEKQAAIDDQKKECHRWEKLHGLIGSSDGKKYRNFAQGLTFELMVSHANRQLEKMSDRYLLIRDSAQPLELNVVDNYQAGEVRSTKNLSGGESFIVSLTLALGLSKMASRKVRVDSLFLDEGFGTLDEEALETALETLSGLHQDGKLIGVISHVQALKERLSTQIQVTSNSGGKSQISGPGCRMI